jgi:4-oxalocrotonate tautomerase family enzyme
LLKGDEQEYRERYTPREVEMAIVRVTMLEGRSPEQKTKIAEGITKVMAEHAKSTPSQTYVVFDDVSVFDWAIGGETIAQRK